MDTQQSNQKVVLLVEDEQDIREVYSAILEEAGYIVLQAVSGSQGIEIANSQNWDLMLLDIMLPGEDGIHVLKKIKENPQASEKPIILLTNLENETIITECFDLGADGYLIKSEITPDYIVKEVSNYFN